MYYYDEGEAISYDNDASIQPFAQTDTMISLMKGIHPTMYETILGKLDDALGFVWVNHKQWFQQDMNPQMMERR